MKKRSLSDYYRFGENRGRSGNKKLKRKESRDKSAYFNCKRLRKKGFYTDLQSQTLVEPLEDEEDTYLVSFRNKPLIDKIFVGMILQEWEHIANQNLIEKSEKTYADLQHAIREIERNDDEDVKERYRMIAQSKSKKLSALSKLSNNASSYPKAKLKKITLRVTEIIDYDNAWHCIAKPAFI